MGGLSDKYSYLNINISPMHNYGYYWILLFILK